MNKLALHLSSKWYRFSNYEIIDGIIQPTQNATVKVYNPFDFFTSNMDFKQKNVNKSINVDDVHIHASFTSIFSEEDALKWVNKFGIPYARYVDKKGKICGINFPSVNTSPSLKELPSIKVSNIVKNANVFRNTIILHDAIKSDRIETVRNIVTTNSFKYNYDFLMSKSPSGASFAYQQSLIDKIRNSWDNSPSISSHDESDDRITLDPYWVEAESNPIEIGQHYLSTLIAFTTQSVHETLVFEQDSNKKPSFIPKIGFKFGSLLALMYKMLFIDWTHGHSIRRCANKLCNNHFVPSNVKNEYCSDLCVNRAKSQRHRKKVLTNKKEKQSEV